MREVQEQREVAQCGQFRSRRSNHSLTFQPRPAGGQAGRMYVGLRLYEVRYRTRGAGLRVGEYGLSLVSSVATLSVVSSHCVYSAARGRVVACCLNICACMFMCVSGLHALSPRVRVCVRSASNVSPPVMRRCARSALLWHRYSRGHALCAPTSTSDPWTCAKTS